MIINRNFVQITRKRGSQMDWARGIGNVIRTYLRCAEQPVHIEAYVASVKGFHKVSPLICNDSAAIKRIPTGGRDSECPRPAHPKGTQCVPPQGVAPRGVK